MIMVIDLLALAKKPYNNMQEKVSIKDKIPTLTKPKRSAK